MAKASSGWLIREDGFSSAKIEILGSKLLIGNGYLGYRGTLEEFSKSELVACTLSGIYDRKGDAWREPVNAPNAFFTRLYAGKKLLNPLLTKPHRHGQSLDIRHGIHSRETVYRLPGGAYVRVRAERFASMAQPHLLCLNYSVAADRACELKLETSIDSKVWDINGPHFSKIKAGAKGSQAYVLAKTNEGKSVAVATDMSGFHGRSWKIKAEAGREYRFSKFAAVFSSQDSSQPLQAAQSLASAAQLKGYSQLLAESSDAWDRLWDESDVQIEGDEAAQQALRYSIYHLLSIAPSHTDKASIPARGLSGQVYKGAIFWDTEMFMLPFFNATQPHLARNLVRYRFHTLPGARRKAKSLGYRGAFYSWESQESGDEACTLFNITDILTNRPLRTYFADKQIHISADVAHGIWQYYLSSGDESLLLEGGAEVIWECARFFDSYAYFKADKGRYEMLDVTGPDEYHERVHNNAFSSAMAKQTVSTALEVAKLLKKKHPAKFKALVARLHFKEDLENLQDLHERLYVPQPDPKSGVIEQFDGYHKLEDLSIKNLKKRLLNPKEYLGGGQGIATSTKVIKQADVLTLLNVLGGQYSAAVKKANWEFYEPRTEHGSSLSPCVYALVAAAIGKTEWAYRYFLKTATVDLSGDSKQYVGTLYIGGTHPAANGGAWMAAVLGFGGLRWDGKALHLNASLPKRWKSLSFRVAVQGQRFSVKASRQKTLIRADASNSRSIPIKTSRKSFSCRPGTLQRA